MVHEYITVTPEGMRYRSKVHRSVNQLFRWFKEHFRDPIPRATPFQTPLLGTPAQQFGPNATPSMQAVKRVAGALPNHMFDKLSQVAAPFPNTTPVGGQGWGQSTPSQRTPSFGPQGTPRSNMPTPQQSNWGPPGSMPPPMGPPRSSGFQRTPRSGADWAEMAQNWGPGGDRRMVKRTPKTPSYQTPGASSQMSISPTSSPAFKGGDQTPLIDEWQNN